VTVPSGAIYGSFDLYDAAGQTLLSAANETGVPVTAPPGGYRLTQYFNPAFPFAQDVVVEAGKTAVVPLGAILLQTVPGSVLGSYDIYASGGATLLSEANDADVPVAAPPGTYVLRQYFNSDFTYAAGVTARAGEITAVPMGAIRYHGTLSYDLYVNGRLVSAANAPGDIVTAPPGTYSLFEYFTYHALAEDVNVEAGAVTEVP